jgi:glutamine synthetase
MIKTFSHTILEYIWIGGRGEIRSKTRVINRHLNFHYSNIPEWNYDGSSTWQAESNGDTEVILKPVAVYIDPIRNIDGVTCYLVLCDTYNSRGEPIKNNYRHLSNLFFEQNENLEPWFGIEQEYFIILPANNKSTDFSNTSDSNEGYHYCGRSGNYIERTIAEQHLQFCLEAGLKISGINSEVSPNQWEFQIGPCVGINAADEMIIARYLLYLVAEEYNAKIDYHPKPVLNINGSGCHINFSTKLMRNEQGISEVYNCINRLEKKHSETIKVYGDDNNLRLTGLHETSAYDKFSWGVGTRNTSIRIPNCSIKNNHITAIYLEDRRPAANIDPYLATYTLFKHACFE